jgi:hypothetical protein
MALSNSPTRLLKPPLIPEQKPDVVDRLRVVGLYLNDALVGPSRLLHTPLPRQELPAPAGDKLEHNCGSKNRPGESPAADFIDARNRTEAIMPQSLLEVVVDDVVRIVFRVAEFQGRLQRIVNRRAANGF